ncbi:MAG: YeeE/YedE family protein, partial [Proteobacteria bacterium]|nr:YeeE/YedE family protein [Pseudomonadota bacterium]
MHDFTPVPALIGGALIGLASVWLLAANGRIPGVSN